MNKKERDLLAYCGLYCGDCAGYNGEIAEAAADLKDVLDQYRFKRTAEELFSKHIPDYERFQYVLSFISKLRCNKVCRGKCEGDTKCVIRACCIERGYYGCHECAEYTVCSKLETISGLHKYARVQNLTAIKEMGPSQWKEWGKRLWFGDE